LEPGESPTFQWHEEMDCELVHLLVSILAEKPVQHGNRYSHDALVDYSGPPTPADKDVQGHTRQRLQTVPLPASWTDKRTMGWALVGEHYVALVVVPAQKTIHIAKNSGPV
jgi:hypothetical protein